MQNIYALFGVLIRTGTGIASKPFPFFFKKNEKQEYFSSLAFTEEGGVHLGLSLISHDAQQFGPLVILFLKHNRPLNFYLFALICLSSRMPRENVDVKTTVFSLFLLGFRFFLAWFMCHTVIVKRVLLFSYLQHLTGDGT